MPFIEDMQERDLALLQALDGREVVYTPLVGVPRLVSGMLQAYSELAAGESVDVVVAQPVLSIRTSDITEIQVGDNFNIDSQDYEVAIIRPDSEGITELMLEKL